MSELEDMLARFTAAYLLPRDAVSRIEDLERTVVELGSQLEMRTRELSERLNAIERFFGRKPKRSSKPTALQWIQNNRETLSRYRGKQLAIHPIRGVVAAGDNLNEVYDKVEALGLQPQEVTLFVVPRH